MTPKQLTSILIQLEDKIKSVDKETAALMDQVFDALEEWSDKDAFAGEIPYRQDLEEWGITLPDVDTFAVVEPVDDSAVIVEEKPADVSDTVIADAPPPAAPHPLQREYDNAVVYLENGRYYGAKQAFEVLQKKAEGEWLIKAEDGYREAREKLAKQVRPLITEAESFAKNSPNDLQRQRNLWADILESDRDNVAAKQALSQLQHLGDQQEVEEKIGRYRQDMELALQKRSLPSLNRVFGDVTSLQKSNEIEVLQQELDDLAQGIGRERERLRDQLGAASTLAVSGNQKEAYKQAQAYIDEGLETVIDASGELFGTAGAEIEPFRFYKKAQSIFLDSLKGLAQQRQDLADGQKGENPSLALDTLQNAVRHLTGKNEQGDDEGVLQKEDRDELEPTLILIQRSIQEIEERLSRFNSARDNVLEAQQPGARAERQLQLYRKARETYAEYPEIDAYIDAAQDAQASVEAGRLLDQMIVARRHTGEDQFEEAIVVLQVAREEVIGRIPHPKDTSDLQKRLNEIRDLEELILVGERDYKRMMSVLQEVDDLLQTYIENKSPDLLVSARTRLEQLTEKESKHHEARERQTRLIDLQGVDESLKQGLEAYRLGEWTRAIEQLQKVAESKDAKEKDEAVTLIYRAQAAEHVINARKEEGGRNWYAALDKYSEAQRLFNQHDVDEQTEHLSRECEQTLVRLKPLEEHDRRVRHAIQQAESLLAQAVDMVQGRRSILGKVEPVEQYQRAVDVLIEVRQQDTTLADELEEVLRDARGEWRRTYIDGMRQARHSKDENILKMAVQLGKDLYERSLLYEAEDKQIYQEVQEHYLELEYVQLKDDPATDSALIEENRRLRLSMASVKTDDLRTQYREAIETRVLVQMGEHRRERGIEASYAFLQEEIVKPALYQSEKLLVEYMHLCWELEDWGEAQRQAESLEFRGQLADAKAKSNMWHGLTEAATLLNDGDMEASRAEIQQLEAQIQGNAPQLGATLAVEERWLRVWRVDRLVILGRAAAKEDDDEKNIEAAQFYAQAFQLSPTDIRVESGLRQIGGRLDANLRVYAEQAKNIRIRRSLEESIKLAKGLENILEALLGVAAALQLERDTQEELKDGLERLQARLDPWQEIQAKLTQIQREIADALAYPEPLQRDEEGGWQFEEIGKQVGEARRLTPTGDREILGLLNEKQEEIREFDDKARELNEAVRVLVQAIQDEAFDDVLISANRLETLWDSYSIDGFQGIDQLIRYRYPFLKRDVNRLSEHKKQANAQKRNLSAWQDWANQVEHHYRDVRGKSRLLKLSKPVNDALDTLREDKKLKEIAQLCLEVIHGSEEFEDALELHPDTDPSSAKAAQEKARVVDGWKTEVFEGTGADRAKAHALLDKIDADIQALKDLLRKLKGAVRQLNAAAGRVGKKSSLFGSKIESIPKTHFDRARKALRACEELDLNHEDVLEARAQIRELEEKYLGERRR